ncbi:hypothetical protein HBB16_16160 [Pseudonocardia sp. MCCB 268]|nr:hypothetical protein [Pseudonocardia cytotoxica]
MSWGRGPGRAGRPWVVGQRRAHPGQRRRSRGASRAGCDVGVTNHYHLAWLLAERPTCRSRPTGYAGRGVHVNISGAGIVAH